MRLRFPLAVLLGAGAYLVLLQVSYGFLKWSYYPSPQWWRDYLHPRVVASASWFVLINVAGAILAAVPVGISVVLLVKQHRLALSVLVGLLPSLYIMGGGVLEYGLPHYT